MSFRAVGVGGIDVTRIGEGTILVGVSALVLGALVIVGAWWLLRRGGTSPGRQFERLLGQYDEVTVLLHPNPDPDAMASALATKTLADAVDTDARITFPGQIRRQENRAFETVLGLECERIEGGGELAGETVVLVDHNEPRGFPGASGIDPVAVIDHHPGGGEGQQFTDVRPDRGACATIFTGYFEELGWELSNGSEDADGETRLSPQVATALLYGIQSDTDYLTNGCSPAEFEAAAYLYQGVDRDLLDRVANPEVDAEVLDVKAAAITGREVHNAHVVSDVGSVSNVDAIPQAADELLRMEGVSAVVVLGDRDGTIHLSGRSRDDRVHMGKALQSAVDDIPMAEAGGHARMGGGQLSTDHMEGLGPGQGVSREQLHRRLFETMTGERQ